jgi:hypothetical protein
MQAKDQISAEVPYLTPIITYRKNKKKLKNLDKKLISFYEKINKNKLPLAIYIALFEFP